MNRKQKTKNTSPIHPYIKRMKIGAILVVVSPALVLITSRGNFALSVVGFLVGLLCILCGVLTLLCAAADLGGYYKKSGQHAFFRFVMWPALFLFFIPVFGGFMLIFLGGSEGEGEGEGLAHRATSEERVYWNDIYKQWNEHLKTYDRRITTDDGGSVIMKAAKALITKGASTNILADWTPPNQPLFDKYSKLVIVEAGRMSPLYFHIPPERRAEFPNEADVWVFYTQARQYDRNAEHFLDVTFYFAHDNRGEDPRWYYTEGMNSRKEILRYCRLSLDPIPPYPYGLPSP